MSSENISHESRDAKGVKTPAAVPSGQPDDQPVDVESRAHRFGWPVKALCLVGVLTVPVLVLWISFIPLGLLFLAALSSVFVVGWSRRRRGQPLRASGWCIVLFASLGMVVLSSLAAWASLAVTGLLLLMTVNSFASAGGFLLLPFSLLPGIWVFWCLYKTLVATQPVAVRSKSWAGDYALVCGILGWSVLLLSSALYLFERVGKTIPLDANSRTDLFIFLGALLVVLFSVTGLAMGLWARRLVPTLVALVGLLALSLACVGVQLDRGSAIARRDKQDTDMAAEVTAVAEEYLRHLDHGDIFNQYGAYKSMAVQRVSREQMFMSLDVPHLAISSTAVFEKSTVPVRIVIHGGPAVDVKLDPLLPDPRPKGAFRGISFSATHPLFTW